MITPWSWAMSAIWSFLSLSYEYYLVWKNQPNTNIIWSEKSPKYENEYYSVWKNHPNTHTNIILFEKITRIWIRILFGLKKSPKYEYEYYSVWKYRPNTNTNIFVFEYYSNNIRIPNYLLTSGSVIFQGSFVVLHGFWPTQNNDKVPKPHPRPCQL